MPYNEDAPVYLSASIPAGAAVSGTINSGAQTLHGVLIPSNWTAADLTFEISVDGGATFFNMKSTTNAEIDYQVAAGSYVAIDPTLWRAINCFRIRSGTSAVPVNQAANVTLEIVLAVLP